MSYFNMNSLVNVLPKCEFMQIDTCQSLSKTANIAAHINNELLERISTANYLGMHIDQNLKWDIHTMISAMTYCTNEHTKTLVCHCSIIF